MSNVIGITTVQKSDEPDTIRDKILTAEDRIILNKMNDKYFHVSVGGKNKIASFKPCPIDGKKLSFEAPSEFYLSFSHLPLVADQTRGRAWFQWSGKNFYPNGIGYYPDKSKIPIGVYNTFQPFPCKPIEGNINLIMEHVRDVICNGEEKASTYFIQWLAHIIQKPMEKPTVAILLKSAEGTGKGTLYKLLKKILGTNAYQVNGAYQIINRFNAVLAGRLLVFGDEVDLTSKAVFDKVKGVISEETISMELKGVDPEQMANYARFMFAGNHDSVISAGMRERRFLVLEPSTRKIGDAEYWKRLNELIDGQGSCYFLHYLETLDLSDFSPYKAPTTKGLIEEKISSLKPSLAYIYNELCKEKPFDGTIRISSTDFIQQFRNWTESNGESISTQSAGSQMGKTMRDMKIATEGRRGRGSGMIYKLPKAGEFRNKFASLLGDNKEQLF